jgi:benzoyl-CoA reductase/2-hydroxyglutaryl-CoA dehydratase subunit BcrC/BadD/HgdB
MPDRWEQCIGSARIDLLVDELRGLIRHLETLTGRSLEMSRLREVMALSNEHAEWNRRTRDLLARTRPCPIPVNDVIPGVMVPQWHRGTEWARDMARRLYDEVAGRIEAGHAVVADERLRLMWIGRGVWHDMSLYRRFEESHGAVFVWSMYLALAADAYARYGPDPLRAVAARFCAFHDQMYVPPWSGEWYVKEARGHGVDGVVHLVSPDSRNGWAATHALRTAGVPVLEIRMDNADAREYDAAAVQAQIAQWLDELKPLDGTSRQNGRRRSS